MDSYLNKDVRALWKKSKLQTVIKRDKIWQYQLNFSCMGWIPRKEDTRYGHCTFYSEKSCCWEGSYNSAPLNWCMFFGEERPRWSYCTLLQTKLTICPADRLLWKISNIYPYKELCLRTYEPSRWITRLECGVSRMFKVFVLTTYCSSVKMIQNYYAPDQ